MRDIRISRSFLLCVELEGRSGSVRRVGVRPRRNQAKKFKNASQALAHRVQRTLLTCGRLLLAVGRALAAADGLVCWW